jgi:hypothetical protein
MSTYLVGLVVGDLGRMSVTLKADSDSPLVLSLLAAHDKLMLGQHVLRVATACLFFLEEYFDSSFPLPKLDLIALPVIFLLLLLLLLFLLYKPSKFVGVGCVGHGELGRDNIQRVSSARLAINIVVQHIDCRHSNIVS